MQRVLVSLVFTFSCLAQAAPAFFDYGSIPVDQWHPIPQQTQPDGTLSFGALRFRSFGKGTLTATIQTQSGRALAVAITDALLETPWPTDSTGAKAVSSFRETRPKFSLAMELPRAGVYALRIAPENGQADASLRVKLHCEGACTRPEISVSGFLAGGQRSKSGALSDWIEKRVRDSISDRALQEKLIARWRALQNSGALAQIDRFPVVPPPGDLGRIVPLLAGADRSAPQPDAVIHGDLAELLSAGKADALAVPPAIAKDLPETGYGHFPDLTLPHLAAAQSPVFARILTSLAAGNGSAVSLLASGKSVRCESLEPLFQALIDSGHTIEVTNDRSFANFIAFTEGKKYVRWPLWEDSGLRLSDGGTLVVPTGHSQHTFRIYGPRVNARVAFYLGIHGAGFFEATDERPAWTGWRTKYRLTSENPADTKRIFLAAHIAQRYLHVIRTQRGTVAKGLPADGYGYLGICSDSTAVVEQAIWKTQSTYPNIRKIALDENTRAIDASLADLFAALPKDGDVRGAALNAEPYHTDALRRAFEMTPYPLYSRAMPDKKLHEQLSLLAKEHGWHLEENP